MQEQDFRQILDEKDNKIALQTSTEEPRSFHHYSAPLGRVILIQAIAARAGYEIAERAEQGDISDLVVSIRQSEKENPGYWGFATGGIGIKEGVDLEKWFYVPSTFAASAFASQGNHPPTLPLLNNYQDIAVVESELDFAVLDSIHHVLFPLYRHGYRELCTENGILPEDIEEVTAAMFYKRYTQYKLELVGIEPSSTNWLEQLRDQERIKEKQRIEDPLRAKVSALIHVFWPTATYKDIFGIKSLDEVATEEDLRKAFVRQFSRDFLGYFGRLASHSIELYSRKRRNPIGIGGDAIDGDLKIQLLKEDHVYRADAKIYSRMMLQGIRQKLAASRQQVIDDIHKSNRIARQMYGTVKEIDAEKLYLAMQQMLDSYAQEMKVQKR